MNLFHNPTVDELQSLLQSASESKNIHDVVLDYDGEVLIDPQVSQPNLDLNKFKFRVQLTELSKRALSLSSAPLRYLYNNLMRAWDSEGDFSSGSIA